VVAAAVVTALIIGTSTPTLPPRFDFTPLTAADAQRRLDNATVELLVVGCDLTLRQGTGVAVGDGRYLTNAHVIGAYRAIYLSFGNRPPESPTAVVERADADVAELRFRDKPATTGLALAPFDPLPRASVRFAGFPHDAVIQRSLTTPGPTVLSAAVVDYERGTPLGQPGLVMRLNALARPGMSGGPVLDAAGDIAGVVFAVQSPADDTLALPASSIRRLLDTPPARAPTSC
jgi:S1-C subfamily serine protease